MCSAKIYGNDKPSALQFFQQACRAPVCKAKSIQMYMWKTQTVSCSCKRNFSFLVCYPWPRFIGSILGIPSVRWKIFSYGIQMKLTILIDLTSISRIHPFLCSCNETVWCKVSYIPWHHHLCYHRWTYAR